MVLPIRHEASGTMSSAAKRSGDGAFSATASLRLHVLTETDLDRLTDRFAGALGEHGIAGHYCARRGESGRVVPLFGDSPALFGAEEARPFAGAVPAGPDGACAMTIEGAPADPFEMRFSGPAEALDKAAVARLRGYATLYVARAVILQAKLSGPVTASGLTLCERFILGRILVGDKVIDIAGRLGQPVPTVLAEIADAMATLGVEDRADAVALAARRGWLVTTLSDFPSLSRENKGYYS